MSAKHDKGPWLAQRWSDSHRDYNIHAEDGGIIALVSGRCGELAESDAANARLIAAAPELMEALEGYINAVETVNAAMKDGVNVHGALTAFQGWQDMAKAALAKAAGKEEG